MKVPLTEKRQKRKNKQTEEIVLDVCVLCFSVPSICISGNTIFSKYKHFIASVTCQFGFLLPMTNIHFEAKIHWHCSGSILWQLSTCLSTVYCRPLASVTFLLYCMCMPSSPVNTGFTNQPGLKSWGSLSAITKLRLTVLQVERTNDEVINDWTIKIISLPVFVCKSRVFTEGLVHRKYPTISPRIANQISCRYSRCFNLFRWGDCADLFSSTTVEMKFKSPQEEYENPMADRHGIY